MDDNLVVLINDLPQLESLRLEVSRASELTVHLQSKRLRNITLVDCNITPAVFRSLLGSPIQTLESVKLRRCQLYLPAVPSLFANFPELRTLEVPFLWTEETIELLASSKITKLVSLAPMGILDVAHESAVTTEELRALVQRIKDRCFECQTPCLLEECLGEQGVEA